MDELAQVRERVASQSWDADRDVWQAVLNERAIPPLRLQNNRRAPVAVRARVVWARDGVQWTDTFAVDWVGDSVLVEMHDRRRQTKGVWLPAADIARR